MQASIRSGYWLLKRFGLQSSYAEISRPNFNWAAGLTWFLTLGACFCLVRFAGIQIFFVSLPGWFVAAVLYIVLSKLYQSAAHQAPDASTA